MIQTRLTIMLCLLIATVVVLSSVHLTQLAAAAQVDKKVSDDTVKIHAELHSHIDKAGKVVTDSPLVDMRSLRLRDVKRVLRNSRLGNLFGAWRNYLTMYVS